MNLQQAQLYLVSPGRLAAGSLAELTPELLDAGVDVIQLREKELEAGEVLALAEPVAAACAHKGVPFVINDRPDIALALGCGVHLGQGDLPVSVARRIVGPEPIVGLSTHSREDLAAVPAGVDYVAVGPVFETPTKPGRAAAGTELLGHAASVASLPWFAIGGINRSNIDEVLRAGARRVVVVRAVTEASDPIVAAAALKERLRALPP